MALPLSRSRLAALALASCGFAAFRPATADEPKPPAPAASPGESPRAAEIAVLIERLGAPEFKARETAREALLKIAEEAAPQLEKAAKDENAERAANVKELLATLRWKLPKNLEAMLGKPLEDYPSQPFELRQQGLEKVEQNLVQARSLAPFLANVARFDPSPELRAKGLDLYLRLTPEGDRPRDELILEGLANEAPRPALHLLRAKLYRRLGRADEAVAAAQEAVAAKVPEAPLFLVDLHLEAGRFAPALELLEAMVKAAPQDVELQARLGEAYLLAGETKKGETVLQALVKTKIGDRRVEKDVFLRVARAWIRVNRPEDAREALKLAVARQPYDHDVNVALAEHDLALDHPALALKRFLNEARYVQRDSEQLRRLRANLEKTFAKLGYPEVAAEDDLYEDARRGRKLAPARERAARFLSARGLAEEAAAAYRAAAALDPENVEARLRLGDALRRVGRDDEAKKAYASALAIAPKDERVAERLKSLALGTAVEGGVPLLARQGDVASWSHRIPREELLRLPEGVAATAPPPLVLAGRVVLVAGGTSGLFGLDPATGNVAWKLALPNPPVEGIAADRLGLEAVGLLPVPPAAAAALAPRRAREAVPLVAVLVNEWVRGGASRSWRRAAFAAAFVALVDPRDGKHLGTLPLLDEPLLSIGSPVARGAQALVLTSAGEERTNLVLVDLVARKSRWRQPLTGGASGRPVFAGDHALAPFGTGVALFAPDGDLKATPLEGATPSTNLTSDGASVWFGLERSLRRVTLASGKSEELFSLPEGEVLSGSVAVLATRIFVGSRGGPLRAFDPATGKPVAIAKLEGSDRAASRTLALVSGKLFALNASDDSYRDEVPALFAFDPTDLAVVWRRPVDRPAALGSGEGLCVAVSGGLGSVGGLKIVGARPGAALADARPRLLAEMRAAAEDALADDEAEVSVLLARRFVAMKGGLALVPSDDLVFLARALARSRRPEDAESVLAVAKARDPSPDAEKRLAELKKELGLEKPAPPEPPPEPRVPPGPGPGQPTPGPGQPIPGGKPSPSPSGQPTPDPGPGKPPEAPNPDKAGTPAPPPGETPPPAKPEAEPPKDE